MSEVGPLSTGGAADAAQAAGEVRHQSNNLRRGGGGAVPSLAEVVSETYVPLEFSRRRSGSGEIQVATFNCHDLTIVRSVADPWRARLRHQDAESGRAVVVFVQRGAVLHTQGPAPSVVGPGGVAVWDSCRDAEIDVLAQVHKLAVVVPRRRLLELDRGVPAPCAPSAPGLRLFTGYLGTLLTDLHHMTPTQRRGAAEALTSLVRLVLWPHPDRVSLAGPSLVATTTEWIDKHLYGELDPSRIAAAQGVSLRTLQAAFAEAGQTVSRTVLDRRLDEAHRVLSREPSILVSEVARLCGFRTAAHFTRSFRTRFGTTPSEVKGSHARDSRTRLS
ncbi:AraC family transcriptional regulator [Gordonia sp. NPDC003376]